MGREKYRSLDDIREFISRSASKRGMKVRNYLINEMLNYDSLRDVSVSLGTSVGQILSILRENDLPGRMNIIRRLYGKDVKKNNNE